MKISHIITSLVLLHSASAWAQAPKAKYHLYDLQGKIRGMHILGNELNGKPSGGSLALNKGEKEGEECFSSFIKGEYPRSGYRASNINACGKIGSEVYFGKQEKVYLFSDEPFFVDQDMVEVKWNAEQAQSIDQIRITTKRVYNKKQYFQALGMGIADFISFGATRFLWGNMRDTFTQDLVHGFESYASDVSSNRVELQTETEEDSQA
ncbi:MAG: hypothetical protein HRU09_19355 [Oligoflexales bacterium]|nr:hypothetical protein [Oligoflexales bacterium]